MTLLREFMTAKNFTAAVNDLAEPICRRFVLPDVCQLGLVVPDAVAADEVMVRDWGLDPSFMLDGEAALWIENGKELHVRGGLGFTYHQGYELELIEPRQGADFYARDLNPDGEIFLHHFGFPVHDLDLQTARLTSQGAAAGARAHPFRTANGRCLLPGHARGIRAYHRADLHAVPGYPWADTPAAGPLHGAAPNEKRQACAVPLSGQRWRSHSPVR